MTDVLSSVARPNTKCIVKYVHVVNIINATHVKTVTRNTYIPFDYLYPSCVTVLIKISLENTYLLTKFLFSNLSRFNYKFYFRNVKHCINFLLYMHLFLLYYMFTCVSHLKPFFLLPHHQGFLGLH